jgi:lipoyl-dependent peroxiredoxin
MLIFGGYHPWKNILSDGCSWMNPIKRQAHVHWAGDITDGQGQTTTESKALDSAPVSFGSRFEKASGTNPEELVAAAHASCFTMMLVKLLSDDKKSVEQIDTRATVLMEKSNGSPRLSEIHLFTQGKVTGMDQQAFQSFAEKAKEQCPVSVLLKPGLNKIVLEAKLI